MIGSCGCFGREETPPHSIHVVLERWPGRRGRAHRRALARRAARRPRRRPGRRPSAVVALAAVALYLLYAAFVELPRTLAAGRRA